MQTPKLTIIIPHFDKSSQHWLTVCSAAEQLEEPFDLVVGCVPDALIDLISYINEYRFSEEECFLNRMEIVDDNGLPDQDAYFGILKSKVLTPHSIVLEPGKLFRSRESLHEIAAAMDGSAGDPQELAEPRIKSAGSSSFFGSFSDAPVPEDLKKRIFGLRDEAFKRTRLSNIIDNLIWVIFFLMIAAFCRSFSGGILEKLTVPAEILSYLCIAVCVVRVLAKAAVTMFDKFIQRRRGRRERS